MAGVEDLSATGLSADGEAQLAALEAQAIAELNEADAREGAPPPAKGRATREAAPTKSTEARPKTATQRKKDAAAAKASRSESNGGVLSSEEEIEVQPKKRTRRKRVASEDDYEEQ